MTDEDIETFKSDPDLLVKVMASRKQYMDFLKATGHWLRRRDHNHLRITRVIRFLTLIGEEEAARKFCDFCLNLHPDLPEGTERFWRGALEEHPFWLAMGGS